MEGLAVILRDWNHTALVLPVPDGWNEEIKSARADVPKSLFCAAALISAFVARAPFTCFQREVT